MSITRPAAACVNAGVCSAHTSVHCAEGGGDSDTGIDTLTVESHSVRQMCSQPSLLLDARPGSAGVPLAMPMYLQRHFMQMPCLHIIRVEWAHCRDHEQGFQAPVERQHSRPPGHHMSTPQASTACTFSTRPPSSQQNQHLLSWPTEANLHMTWRAAI
jgi:hypothetical protein